MIRSMTGFGEAEGLTPAGRLRVELRTVNHRYLNVNTRLPNALARWEGDIREWLRKDFVRGHVNCTVRLDRDAAPGAALGMRLDPDKVEGYLALFAQLRDRFGVTGDPDVSLISRFGDIFVREEPDAESTEISADEFRAVIESAARATVVMRGEEGRRLEVDLNGRLAATERALGEIQEIAPERLRAERDRLRAAVEDLAGGVSIDENRIAQEIAFLAERWDINEELVRFRAHLDLFRQLLGESPEEGVGKRLSFLVQEMHREANTIGSKANHAAIAHRVVAIKEEIERLREQVENVE
ncbi:MAG: YicC family protein [Gemmatimonadetes bacterium]|nr:YicC family protein [Gemmatimonadota bacterium]